MCQLRFELITCLALSTSSLFEKNSWEWSAERCRPWCQELLRLGQTVAMLRSCQTKCCELLQRSHLSCLSRWGHVVDETGEAGIRTMHCGNLWIPSWTLCSWQSQLQGISQCTLWPSPHVNVRQLTSLEELRSLEIATLYSFTYLRWLGYSTQRWRAFSIVY